MTNEEWLKDKCARYQSSGECRHIQCLVRGHWDVTMGEDFDLATCHPHEILIELEELENKYQAACGWH